jgi:DNA-binding response OmpR family regulator
MNTKQRILVVDDDQPILMLMQRLLSEFGFEAATAESGEAALAIASDGDLSLVLLDLNMPGMGGAETVKALRATAAGRDVPILILSGHPVPAAEIEELGVDGAVQKPFDLFDLLQRIRSLVGTATT